jgi:hypothetical protein
MHTGCIKPLQLTSFVMLPLTKDVVAKIERVCALQTRWNILKFTYVVSIICVCAYASYSNIYGFLYHRIVSFILTANVIWVFYDLFCSPIKEIMGIIRDRAR